MNIDKEIVNRALDKAGEEPINDTEWETGTSTRIRLVKDYYLVTILETLSNTDWTSQKKRAALELDTDTENLTEYSYVYSLPLDCAKPVKLKGEGEYFVEGNNLYTDTENAILVYISNSYTGKYNYTLADPQPTAENFTEKTYYYKDANDSYFVQESYDAAKDYYTRDEEDYYLYADIKFDALLSEYIETRLASKMVLKLTGDQSLYQLLYSEAALMEKRAMQASEAHGFNKNTGNKYWGETLGLPSYDEV